jgi:hypothetical protein
MPDAQLIPDTASLRVKTHVDAELFLIGNDRQLVARAVGELHTVQPKGLYRIKAVRASAAIERLLELDRDTDIGIDVPGLDTTVPFRRTMAPEAVAQIEKLADEVDGEQTPSRLLLIGRVPAPPGSGDGAADPVWPLSAVRLVHWSSSGEASRIPATEGHVIGGEVWAIAGTALEAGTYVLQIDDGTRVSEQAIPVSPRWQTRVFVRRQAVAPMQRPARTRSSDLLDVAIHMTRSNAPIALEPANESSEIARLALASGSLIGASTRILNILINEKFSDPMAGLAAAHLMFDALDAADSKLGPMPPDVTSLRPLVDVVIANLTRLLQLPAGGSPDLTALKLRAKMALAEDERAIAEPPAYAASWKVLLGASLGATPQVNIAPELFVRCAANFTTGAYFAWAPTTVADFVEHFVASNQTGLQLAAGAQPAPPPPAAAPPNVNSALRSRVRTNVRDHVAGAVRVDPSKLRPTTDLTKRFKVGERDLHRWAGQINRTDWMKTLSTRLDTDDMKGVTTIGGLADVILSKASKPAAEALETPTPMPSPGPAANFTSILANDKSRSSLADSIGIPRAVLEALATPKPGPMPAAASAPAQLPISRRALDMIVEFSVTSRQVYEERYRKPIWPGGDSGIVIGIGYDLGAASKQQLDSDWADAIPAVMIAALEPAAGVKAGAAAPLVGTLAAVVDIAWEAATAVHAGKVIPRLTGAVVRALANCQLIPPDCLGALVSLSRDRGLTYQETGDRFTEMRAIRGHMAALQFSKIAGEIRAMKRLSPDNAASAERREREAKLFEDGLAGMKN